MAPRWPPGVRVTLPTVTWDSTLPAALLVAVLGLVSGRVLNVLARRASPEPSRTGPPGGREDRRALDVAVPGAWVEVGTAALLVVVLVRVGPTATSPAWTWFVLCAVLLAVVDLQHLRLPDRVLLPATTGALLLLTAASAATGGWAALGRGLLGAGALFAGLLVLAVVNPDGLGMGDVKLGVLLGLQLGYLGWPALLAGVLIGFVLQAVLALALLGAGRAGLRTDLPFGPALLGGALVVGLLTGG